MELIHLPPDVVLLLDALYAGRTDCEEELARFLAVRDASVAWLEFHGAYSVTDEEAALLGNVSVLWNEMEGRIAEGLSELLPRLYEAMAGLDRLRRWRERPDYSRQPPVNDLVRAGGAVLKGRGEARVVTDRLPTVATWLRNVESMFEGARDRLRPEVIADIEIGLRHMRDALSGCQVAAETGDRGMLHDALDQMLAGGELVQHFLDWDFEDQQRLEQQRSRFNIPIIGPSMDLALASARKAPREAWGPAVEHALALDLPRLRGMWSRVRPGIMTRVEIPEPEGWDPADGIPLDLEHRELLLQTVDEGIDALEAALVRMTDPSVADDAALATFELSLTNLSRAFHALDRDALRFDSAAGTAAEPWIELIGGALTGTIPAAAVDEFLRSAAPPPSWTNVTDCLHGWLADPQDAHLLMAAQRLHGHLHVPVDVPLSTTWTCAPCGQAVALGVSSCPRCGAAAQGAASATWEA